MNIYTSAHDNSTNDVIDWIYFLSPNQKVNRFNDYHIPQQISIHIATGNNIQEKSWYRRGSVFRVEDRLIEDRAGDIGPILKSYHTENNFVYEAFLDKTFDPLFTINAATDNDTNKIINLRRALVHDIEIPDTLVSNELSVIQEFLQDDQYYIIKDIALDPILVERPNGGFSIGILPQKYTGIEIRKKLQNVTSTFGFLFIQKYIEKKLELRSFFIKDKFYSMAIFSQNNIKTKTDYRNYDKENPNRCIPFKLPLQVEKKLSSFMKDIKINSGSLDIIYTPDRRFVFLEVNPIGQFQWLARNCNYDIEREIAKFLLS